MYLMYTNSNFFEKSTLKLKYRTYYLLDEVNTSGSLQIVQKCPVCYPLRNDEGIECKHTAADNYAQKGISYFTRYFPRVFLPNYTSEYSSF